MTRPHTARIAAHHGEEVGRESRPAITKSWQASVPPVPYGT